MFDKATEMADGMRDGGAALRERSFDRRQGRLEHKIDALHGELDREREARRALTEAIAGRGKRRHGFLRVVMIGAGAYILGARAGHERYEHMAGWVRAARERVARTARGVQEEAAQTAGQVRDVALDTARLVGEDVKSTATQVREEASHGARQVGEETSDAVQRLRKELAPSSDVVDV
jgi:hypothetical protein